MKCRYCLPEGYQERSEPSYFDDETGEVVWQPDVYADAVALARRSHATRLVDLGCGESRKLVRYRPEFEILGVDIGNNVAVCKERYPFARFLEHDLDSTDPLPLTAEDLRRSLVICSDVIEHLRHPERLLAELRHILPFVQAVVISTPERELTHGRDHRGPPPNPSHVREWSRSEFQELLQQSGFRHLEVGLTRSSDRDHRLRTILAFVFPRPGMEARLKAPR